MKKFVFAVIFAVAASSVQAGEKSQAPAKGQAPVAKTQSPAKGQAPVAKTQSPAKGQAATKGEDRRLLRRGILRERFGN